MTAIDKVREALEKARRLHHNDPADHNVGAFLDEALSWMEEQKKETDRMIGKHRREKLELLQALEGLVDKRLIEKLAW